MISSTVNTHSEQPSSSSIKAITDIKDIDTGTGHLLTLSINSSDLLFVPGTAKGRSLSVLIDSACAGVIVHSKFAELCNTRQKSNIRLKLADGSLTSCCDSGEITLSIKDSEANSRSLALPVVLANIDYDVILGLPGLRRFKLTVDADAHRVNFKELSPPLPATTSATDVLGPP